MSKLATLRDNQAKALAAFDAVTTRHAEALATRSLTDDERAELSAAEDHVKDFAPLIAAAEAEEARAKDLAEAEKRFAPGITGVRDASTYGPGSDHAYTADLVSASHHGFADYVGASERMAKHREEMRSLLERDPRSKEALALRKAMRAQNGNREVRAVDTTTPSMGAFAPNVYLLSDYAPYRLPGRAFADATNKMELPATGMTISLPKVTTASSVTSQGTQNTQISETDPTASYANGTVITLAGQVTVSQQYLDRVGPGVAGDAIIRDSLQRALNQSVDEYVVGQVAANALPVEANGAFSIQAFFSAIGNAKQAVETAAGTIAYPSHIFTDPTLAEYVASRSDSSNRPVFAPAPVALNPVGVGDYAQVPEGYTGFTVGGVPFFKDNNISLYGAATPSNHQLFVGDLSLVYLLESEGNYRVLPQPSASELSVILQLWEYLTVILPYPNAVANLTGTLFASSGLTF